MAESGTNSRQSELGDFLRSRRQKLTPKAGRPAGRAGGGARPVCGARKWPTSPASASTGTSGSSRDDPSGRRRRRSTRWRARCGLAKAEHRHLTELTQNADRRAFVRETVPPADPAHGRAAQPAGLCHRAALGHSRLERGRGRDLRVQPAGGGRSQQPAVGADQPRDAAAVRRVMGGGGQAHGGPVPGDA